MTKRGIASFLAQANAGHALTITYYWVKDGYLLRIADQYGRHPSRAIAIVSDSRQILDADIEAIEYMKKERDQLEDELGRATTKSKVGPGNSQDKQHQTQATWRKS